MARLVGDATLEIPSWIGGIEKEVPPEGNAPGTLADAQNLVPLLGSKLATRGGSRQMIVLHNDAGSPVEVTGLCGLWPWTSIGGIVVGYDTAQHKAYAWYMTQDMALAGSNEANSRVDLSQAPAGWTDGGGPPIPCMAELWEGMFLADAQTVYSQRRAFVSLNQQLPVVQLPAGGANAKVPQFAFAGGAAQVIKPYCLAVYNNVLFVSGYGDESVGNQDRPEYLRHSFLSRSPSNSIALGDATDGFDKDAWNLIGAKGQRITAMTQGAAFLLVAKANELYRISGAGRAYPGWQYAVEKVDNTAGYGCANPLALCYAEGFWYGIGAAGPFRSDGFRTETLVGPRARDFQAVDNLGLSFCCWHPNRRLVLFGVHPSGTSPASYPWILWAWDVARERWQPDTVFSTPTAFAMAQAIPTASVIAPTAPPTAGAVTAITTAGYTVNWTNGDPTAQTEVWELDAITNTWTLQGTAAPGAVSFAVTGDTDHLVYYWKVRHIKGGIPTAYSGGTIPVLTLIAEPGINSPLFNPTRLSIVNNAHGNPVDIHVDQDTLGNTYALYPAQQGPNTVTSGTSDLVLATGHTYLIYAVDGLWTPTSSAVLSFVA